MRIALVLLAAITLTAGDSKPIAQKGSSSPGSGSVREGLPHGQVKGMLQRTEGWEKLL